LGNPTSSSPPSLSDMLVIHDCVTPPWLHAIHEAVKLAKWSASED
jgi:hypothetical protein